uniref:Uncharacterized protein n=1 Tax=Meloidogyne floridensis TaxID=298350 RepID=A0A915P7K5_9BILA
MLNEGYSEKSSTTCGQISGFFLSSLALGSFIGTALGGLSAEHLGFQWTATAVAGIQIINVDFASTYSLDFKEIFK